MSDHCCTTRIWTGVQSLNDSHLDVHGVKIGLENLVKSYKNDTSSQNHIG